MIYCIPTDTCYGLRAKLSDEAWYDTIYRLKWRDFIKPLAFLVESFDDIRSYTDITDEQLSFLKSYPSPFTLLAPPKPGVLPVFLDQDIYRSIGLRVAEICLDQEVRKELSLPLFLTSANRSGESECTNKVECLALLDTIPEEYIFLDGGTVTNPPSDIFSFKIGTTEPVYIRKNY